MLELILLLFYACIMSNITVPPHYQNFGPKCKEMSIIIVYTRILQAS